MKTSPQSGSRIKMGLIGAGINYSLSPRIFNSPEIQEYLPSTFDIINLADAQAWDQFWATKASEYRYLCITTPWKKKVLELPLAFVSPEVATTKVANWISLEDGKLSAFNTDYFAFKKWWLALPQNLPQDIYYLGHGASSYSFYGMLRDYLLEHPNYKPNVYIVTRNLKTLIKDGCHDLLKTTYIDYEDLYQRKLNHHSLLVNGSFYGQKVEFPIELIKIFEQALVWDLNYAKAYNYLSFYQKNGFEFLVNQAMLFLAMQNIVDDNFYHQHQKNFIKSLSEKINEEF